MSSFELPPEQTGPAAWYGPDMTKRSLEWSMNFTPAEIAEVEAVTKPLAAREAEIAAITAADFPLPTLGARIRTRTEQEGLNGRGFLRMRGLPVGGWTKPEAGTAF